MLCHVYYRFGPHRGSVYQQNTATETLFSLCVILIYDEFSTGNFWSVNLFQFIIFIHFYFSWLYIFFCAQFHTRIDFLHSQRKQIRYRLSASLECTMPAFWIDLKSDPISSRSKLFSLWWIVHKCIIHKIQENDKTSYYNSFLASCFILNVQEPLNIKLQFNNIFYSTVRHSIYFYFFCRVTTFDTVRLIVI